MYTISRNMLFQVRVIFMKDFKTRLSTTCENTLIFHIVYFRHLSATKNVCTILPRMDMMGQTPNCFSCEIFTLRRFFDTVVDAVARKRAVVGKIKSSSHG